jgi:putative ABC transport system permease protein
VISFIVVQRTREIGIRVALGAGRREIIGMVGRYSMRIAFIGVSSGFALSLLFSRVMASMIYDIDTTDPATLLGVALTLTLTAFLACFRPAYRAALLDPLVALRTE